MPSMDRRTFLEAVAAGAAATTVAGGAAGCQRVEPVAEPPPDFLVELRGEKLPGVIEPALTFHPLRQGR